MCITIFFYEKKNSFSPHTKVFLTIILQNMAVEEPPSCGTFTEMDYAHNSTFCKNAIDIKFNSLTLELWLLWCNTEMIQTSVCARQSEIC